MNARKRAAAAAALAMLIGACSEPPPPAAEPPTPVRVAAATLGPAVQPIATNGLLVNKDEVRLSFKVGGVIRDIPVQEGAAIKRGQVLARIEPTEIDSTVDQARALTQKAQRDLERGERLYRDQVITLEQLQDLRTQASLADSRFASARYNQGYASIAAPDDGVVLRKLAEARELVPAGQPVLIVGGRDAGFVVRAALADREIVQLALGDPARIRMDAFPDRVFAGVVSELASAADVSSGLFPIEVRLTEAPTESVSGLVARLSIAPARGSEAQLTYVPIAAIVEGRGTRAEVFVVRDGKAVRRGVTIAFIAPEHVALSAGVSAGESVVTDGALFLEDDEAVRIVDSAQRQAQREPSG